MSFQQIYIHCHTSGIKRKASCSMVINFIKILVLMFSLTFSCYAKEGEMVQGSEYSQIVSECQKINEIVHIVFTSKPAMMAKKENSLGMYEFYRVIIRKQNLSEKMKIVLKKVVLITWYAPTEKDAYRASVDHCVANYTIPANKYID